MTTRHTTPLRGAADATRTRAGAAVLLALVVCVPPGLLLAVAGDPLDPPAALRSGRALTGSIDDTSLLWLLAAAAWLLYAHLLATLGVEAVRQTRGSTLRLPLPGLLFGANAALASHLIAALVLTGTPQLASGLTPAVVRTAVTGPAAAGPAHAVPTPPAATVPSAPTTASDPAPTPREPGPTIECRVLPPDGRDHDTLWDIAERHLGDGTRWRDIFALNDGRRMPDGQHLTRASLIQPGWILTLPADAVALEIDRITPVPMAQPLRDAAPATDPAPTERNTASTAPRRTAPARAEQTRAEQAPAEQAPAEQTRRTAAPSPPGAGATANPRPEHAARSNGTSAHADQPGVPGHDDDGLPAELGLGTLLLGAVTVLGALTRRRKVAARRRPPGVRAARPSEELLDTERLLREQARVAADTAATVRLAMTLAGRSLPHAQLRVLWQHPDGSLELVWADPAPGVPVPVPFTATERGWLLPAAAHPLLFATRQPSDGRQPDAARDHPVASDVDGATSDPFPLLMPVGTAQGSACLVNLELVGLISLHAQQRPDPADPSAARQVDVLGAWITSLAAAPWSAPLRICLPQRLEPLATGLDAAQVCDPVPPFLSQLTPDELQQVRAHGSFSTARRQDPNLDSIGFDVFAGYHARELPAPLLHAATDPAQPTVVVLADAHPDAQPWILQADGRLSIPGVADDLVALAIGPAGHDRVLRLLEHAQDPPQAAADDQHRASLRTACPPASLPADMGAPAAAAAAMPTGDEPVLDLTAYDMDSTTSAPRDRQPLTPPSDPDVHSALPDVDQAGPPATGPDDDQPDEEILGPIEVCVLGPVAIRGLDRPLPRQQAVDLLTYMCFHRRPMRSEELWEAVWPGKPYNNHTLRNRIHDLRTFIKPLLHRRPGGGYELDELIVTDWQRFQALADGTPSQQLAALALVRGRPFPRNDLDWFHLEGQQAEIEATIVDLALQVGEQALADEQYDTARTAALAGLRACPWEERLYRIAMRSAAARGATAEIYQLRRQLTSVLDDELSPDDDLQPATSQLIQELRDEQAAGRGADRQRHP